MKKKDYSIGPVQWAAVVFVMAVIISAVLGFASQILLSGAGLVLSVVILAAFILLGIVFDVIGVAATAADPKPLHSMASRKVAGAKEALVLVKNAGRVSSICNDVVGDICGIVSGVTAAVIVVYLQNAFSIRGIAASVGVTALISGLTIGGKALSKTFAVRRGTQVIWRAGQFLHLFRKPVRHRHGSRKRNRSRSGKQKRSGKQNRWFSDRSGKQNRWFSDRSGKHSQSGKQSRSGK